MKTAFIDFESDGIERRPVYPPVPAGFALELNGKQEYMAFNHPTGNNCTKAEAKYKLKEVFKACRCVFHNAAFDISIAINHMGCKMPAEWEDTLYLAYLHDPRDKSIALKSLAAKYLNWPATERDAVNDWIMENTACEGTKLDPVGSYISYAPGGLVGEYAKADIGMTKGLYEKYLPEVIKMGMGEAYTREKKAMPIFEEMSSTGIRIRLPKLKKDLLACEKEGIKLEKFIRKRLRSKDIELTNPTQLADAMDAAGLISQWIYTKTGRRSTSRDNLFAACDDQTLIKALSRWGVLTKYSSMYLNPWLESAEQFDSRVYPNFNQTRNPAKEGENSYGTRTGRPSSDHPNFLNVPKDPKDGWAEGLPFLRQYIAPDEGCVLHVRDYSQQEIRLLGYFEEGDLYNAYLADPNLDVHDFAIDLILKITGIKLERYDVKTIAFGIIYGMGKGAIGKKLGIEPELAMSFKNAYLQAFPGIKQLQREIQGIGRRGEIIRTWGGRVYEVEEACLVDGRMRTWEYKLLNYLIQGSAADVTKQAMINVVENTNDTRLMLQVYDELVCSSGSRKEMKLIKEAMEGIEIDMPMLSDGKYSYESWGDLRKCA